MFRDDYERQAHDIICIIKYGATGGKVNTNDMRRVADIIRGRTLDPPKPKVTMPSFVVAKPPITIGLPSMDFDAGVIKVTMPFKIDITPP